MKSVLYYLFYVMYNSRNGFLFLWRSIFREQALIKVMRVSIRIVQTDKSSSKLSDRSKYSVRAPTIEAMAFFIFWKKIKGLWMSINETPFVRLANCVSKIYCQNEKRFVSFWKVRVLELLSIQYVKQRCIHVIENTSKWEPRAYI